MNKTIDFCKSIVKDVAIAVLYILGVLLGTAVVIGLLILIAYGLGVLVEFIIHRSAIEFVKDKDCFSPRVTAGMIVLWMSVAAGIVVVGVGSILLDLIHWIKRTWEKSGEDS